MPATKKRNQPQTSDSNAQPFRRGDIYCLPNFTFRAEQWYTQEVVRQIGSQILECPSRGESSRGESTRRQPLRTAKIKPVAEGLYVLSSDEVDALRLQVCIEERGQTPPPEEQKKLNVDFEVHVASFCTRLSEAICGKIQKLKALYEPQGDRHICTMADSKWQCLDEEFCGHGLVERSMRWIPKSAEAFRPRVRVQMEEYLAKAVFSLETKGDRHDVLKELKRSRYSKLKKITLATISRIQKEWKQRPRPMSDASMLETPTMGRWPARGFEREDVGLQTVEFAGLVFAVDVCQGETRLFML